MENEIDRLISDDAFKAEIDKLRNDEEIKDFFAGHGMEVKIEDAEEKELVESNLESVVGGASKGGWTWIRIGKKWVKIYKKSSAKGSVGGFGSGGGGRGF